MSLFEYKARDQRGAAVTGTFEGANADAVANYLFESGFTPIDIAPVQEQRLTKKKLLGSKVRLIDLIQFSRQMYSLTKANVPILSALGTLSTTTQNPSLADAISKLIGYLESGRTLASALQQLPKVFPEFYVSMVRIGETSGAMETTFLQLAEYLEREKKTREQIKAAVRYPMFVVVVIAIAFAVINFFVIPAFSSVFAKFGADLPLPTQILLGTSNFMVAHWPMILAALLILVVGLRTYINTKTGRLRWDRLKLKIPLAGRIIYIATMARFSRMFAIASRAGVPIITTLSLVARTLNNAFVEQRVLNMQTGIERGEPMSRTASATGLFDALVLQMMQVGEQTGSVDELLQEVADYYDAQVEYDIQRLSAAIEPILTVAIGILVLILALGVFLPMWDLASAALQK